MALRTFYFLSVHSICGHNTTGSALSAIFLPLYKQAIWSPYLISYTKKIKVRVNFYNSDSLASYIVKILTNWNSCHCAIAIITKVKSENDEEKRFDRWIKWRGRCKFPLFFLSFYFIRQIKAVEKWLSLNIIDFLCRKLE